MPNVLLFVIPEPEPDTRSVVTRGPEGKPLTPFFSSKGDVHLLCGECGLTLVEGAMQAAQFSNIVFHCPRCRTYNETRT